MTHADLWGGPDDEHTIEVGDDEAEYLADLAEMEDDFRGYP